MTIYNPDHYADLAEQALSEDASPADRISSAMELILAALDAARDALRGTSQEASADAYWLAHIDDAVRGAGPAPSMTSAITALRREGEANNDFPFSVHRSNAAVSHVASPQEAVRLLEWEGCEVRFRGRVIYREPADLESYPWSAARSPDACAEVIERNADRVRRGVEPIIDPTLVGPTFWPDGYC